MKAIGISLDSKIASLKTFPPNKSSLSDLFDLHSYLTNEFKKLTGFNKRSLASKYLHFHCSSNVFIYDSIASTAVRMTRKKEQRCKRLYC